MHDLVPPQTISAEAAPAHAQKHARFVRPLTQPPPSLPSSPFTLLSLLSPSPLLTPSHTVPHTPTTTVVVPRLFTAPSRFSVFLLGVYRRKCSRGSEGTAYQRHRPLSFTLSVVRLRARGHRHKLRGASIHPLLSLSYRHTPRVSFDYFLTCLDCTSRAGPGRTPRMR